jgi:subtilisin family serine protease
MLVLIACALSGCASQAQRHAQAMQAAPWLGATDNTAESYIVVTVRNPRAVDMHAASTTRDYDVAQVYGPSPRARSDVNKLASRYALRLVNAWPIEVLELHCVVYAMPLTVDRDELMARLRADRLVESVQPLNSFATLATEGKAPATKQYSDPYFDLQSNLQVLQVPQAQKLSRGAGVRVAVIDTGIDTKHPDLAGRVVVQRNFVGGVSGETPERHGTAVAGVIAALANNNLGIVGIAPAAQLLALRACWPATANDARSLCNTFTLAQALQAAIDLRADVVNLSLGGPADPLLNRLVAAGMQRGIVYVGAINPNFVRTQAMFPTEIAGVISVNTAEGGRAQQGKTLSLFAPGKDILTLTPSGGYDFMSGSSLAAASVTGGVALLLSRRRSTQRNELYEALAKSLRSDSVDLCKAISALDPGASCNQE